MMLHAGVVLIVSRFREREPLILSVTNRAFGGISLPGGKCKDRETPRSAAVRELREETGLAVLPFDLSQLVRAVNVINDESCEVSVYFARAMSGEPRDVEDGTKHRWVTFAELVQESPFADYYSTHLPDGVAHLRPTLRER